MSASKRPTVASEPIPFTANTSPPVVSPFAPHSAGSFEIVEVPERQKSPSDSEHKRLDQTEDEPNSSPRGIETSKLVSAPGLSRTLDAEDSADQQRSCQASPSGSTDSNEDETQFKMSPDTPDVKPQQLHGESDPTQHISVSHGDTEASPMGQRDLLTCGQQGLDLQESGAELASQTASSNPNESADGASGVDGGINLTGQKQSGDMKCFSKVLTKRVIRSKLSDIIVARNGESAKDFTYTMMICLQDSKVEVELVIHVKHAENVKLEAYFKFPQDGKAKRNFQNEIKHRLVYREIIIKVQVEVNDPSERCSLSETQHAQMSLNAKDNLIDETEVLNISNVVPYDPVISSKSKYIEFKMTASIVLCNPEPPAPAHLPANVSVPEYEEVDDLVYVYLPNATQPSVRQKH